MSTIASPRPSITLSSRRGSGSTDTTTRSTSTSRPPPGPGAAAGSLRRNRAALRDYYGLKNAAPTDARSTPPTPTLDAEKKSELDAPNFKAETYVQLLLAKEGLEEVLKVEAGLVGEIRSLDGEKKALVYDNYSKLIAATETIRRMREKMDPLAQTTSLMGDIENIAETAATLSADMREKHGAGTRSDRGGERGKKIAEQKTVQWALGAPDRLRDLARDGKRVEAEEEMRKVMPLLGKWHGVGGVDALREACQEALQAANG